MEHKTISGYAVRALDRVTDKFPAFAPNIFERPFLALMGNALSRAYYRRRYARKMRNVQRFENLLVVVDVNIGDAVLMQSAALALKDCFPFAAIDYACSAAGGALVKHLPGIRQVHNIFTQSMYPSEEDMNVLRGIIRRERYDAVFNLCPFLTAKDLRAGSPVVQLYVPLALEIVRGWRKSGGTRIHLTYLADTVTRALASAAKQKTDHPAVRERRAPAVGATIYVPHGAVAEARTFLTDTGFSLARHLVLVHADAPFRYTQIPLSLQRATIERILLASEDAAVLLFCGAAKEVLEEAILDGLPDHLRRRIAAVPRLSIAGYSALIDACDVFISGDTGPMHIAAARKVPLGAGDAMRNRTAVIGVYGATNSRMSGYDAALPDHIPGMQGAPAKVFVAPAPCRNITCIDKPAKTCAVPRCFDGLQAQEIAEYVSGYLRRLHADNNARPNAGAGDARAIANVRKVL